MKQRFIGPPRKPGRKPGVRCYLQKHFGLTLKQSILASEISRQLAHCKSPEARRLLLGVSEKEVA